MTDPALGRLRVHLQIIDRDVQRVTQRYRDHMQCGPGCSDCCHQTFRVSQLEGRALAHGLAKLAPQVREDIVRRAADYEADASQPCPVLSEDGRCRMYDARPRICRKYGIPLWHPDSPHRVRTCPKNFRGVPDIDPDAIVQPQAQWAQDWIHLRAELGLGPQDDRTIAQWITRAGSPSER